MTFEVPKVMGIINLTPDSFFELSRYRTELPPGADIIDVGACSTRPGSEPADGAEELRRLEEFMPSLLSRYGHLPLSLDTFRPSVAAIGIDKYGFDIINDVSGGSNEMYELCAACKKAYVLTWPYGGGVDDMLYFFSRSLDSAARKGLADVILDPGFGFGKNLSENYELARNLKALDEFGLPVLAGISRKSMLQKLLGLPPSETLNATTALNCMLLDRGADIIRVHDVKEAAEAVKIYKQFTSSADV